MPMLNYVKEGTKHLTDDELAAFSLKFAKRKYSEETALMFWLFGAVLGLHRFYLGQYRSALILIAVTIFTGGFGVMFSIADVMNLRELTEKANKALVLEIVKEVKYRNGEWK